MCRGGKDEVEHRRCLVHSAEGKAECRACEKLKDDFLAWSEAVEKRHTELGAAKTHKESEPVLSRWRMVLAGLMRAMDLTKERLKEKRAALASFRATYYAEKLAAVKNAEKRAAAEEAIKNAEVAQLEFEAAEDAHREARTWEIRTRPMDGFMSPAEVAQWDHRMAAIEHEVALDARDQAWAKLKPVDDQMDPKTGTPTRRKLAYLSAQKDLESATRIEAYMKGLADRTPDHDEAAAALTAAEARLESARETFETAKAVRHSALSMGRPPAEVESAA
jgi:hypothetical protein